MDTPPSAADDFQVAPPVRVPLKKVIVPDFQRGLADGWAQQIADNWNPSLFRPPLLSKRKDGKFEVVDGQHTIEAARRRGQTTIPAFVRNGMGTQEEAGIFADLNTQRKPLRPFQVYVAERMAGRSWAVELDEAARKYGLIVAPDTGPINLACVAQCKVILRRHGQKVLEQALDVLTSAYPDVSDADNAARLERGLVSGMVDLIARATEAKLFDRKVFISKLQEATFKAEGVGVKLTPAAMPSYVAALIGSGRLALTSIQTGSGQSVIHGRALGYAILGVRPTKRLYK